MSCCWRHCPLAPAVIYDIGGGYGEYAWWLASQGYRVHLFDLSETNIRLSAELADEYPGSSLCAAEVADARSYRPRNRDGGCGAVDGSAFTTLWTHQKESGSVKRVLPAAKARGPAVCGCNYAFCHTFVGNHRVRTKNKLLEEDAFSAWSSGN